MYALVAVLVISSLVVAEETCERSVTTASGRFAPKDICSGDLIFEDQFDYFDLAKWNHEITLGGGGNWEFQWYTNNRTNSYVHDGILYIKPSLTADHLGYDALTKNTLDLGGECTNSAWYGCSRTGNSVNILNPIKSAKIRTLNSFSFKYGRVEIRAKMPVGDWLWPAIWMMPAYNGYGSWPASGEIDILESRGNRDFTLDGKQIGTQLMGSTLHWGIDWANDAYPRTHWQTSNSSGFNNDFHIYEFKWSPNNISFYVDEEYVGGVEPPSGGFWELGEWGDKFDNPWKSNSKMAPFDQEFYLIANVAVGGIGYFSDKGSNPGGKPWANNSPKAATDFWDNRNQWLSTWNLFESDDAALNVDYIKVYAL